MVNYGVKVTIIEFLDRALPNEDADVSKEIARQYKKYGVDILTSTKVETVVDNGDRVTVTYTAEGRQRRPRSTPTRCSCRSASRRTSRASASRTPASSSPSAARSRSTTTCAPTCPHIYAIGDVTAKLQLAHVAEAQGVVAAETIGKAETMTLGDYRMMPRATFCSPQVASFGLTEQQARDAGYDVKVAKFPFSANGKANGLGEPDRLRQAHRRRRAPRAARRPPDRPRCLGAAARAHARAEVGPHRPRGGAQRAHAPDAVGGRAGGLPRPRRPHDQPLTRISARRASTSSELVAVASTRPAASSMSTVGEDHALAALHDPADGAQRRRSAAGIGRRYQTLQVDRRVADAAPAACVCAAQPTTVSSRVHASPPCTMPERVVVVLPRRALEDGLARSDTETMSKSEQSRDRRRRVARPR